MNLIEIGRKAVSIDSSVSQGTVDIAEYFQSVAVELGLHCELVKETYQGVDHALVWMTRDPAPAEKDFLMVSHLDTSDPGEYFRWTKTGANPFQASVDGQLVYGLGTADSKFDFIAKMIALAAAEKKAYKKIRPVLAGTFGAETGHGLMKLFRRKKFKPAAALVGRPTDMQLADRGPGYAALEISIPFDVEERRYRENHDLLENSHSQSKVFTSVNKHGLAPDFYDNPIVKALEFVRQLPEGIAIISLEGGSSPGTVPDITMLEMDIVANSAYGMTQKLKALYDILQRFAGAFRQVTSPGFVPEYSTFNVGQIISDSEEIKILGNCRLVPQVTQEIYENWLQVLRRDCEALGARFHVIDYKPPFVNRSEAGLRGTLEGILKESQRSAAIKPTSLASEGSLFSRLGCECFVFGAGQSVVGSQMAHENININDVEASVRIYQKVIDRFCL